MRPQKASQVNRVAKRTMEGSPKKKRLSVRVHPDTLYQVNVEAIVSKRSIERYVLDALAAYGVKLHKSDKGSVDTGGTQDPA